jgi:hypothetical protein
MSDRRSNTRRIYVALDRRSVRYGTVGVEKLVLSFLSRFGETVVVFTHFVERVNQAQPKEFSAITGAEIGPLALVFPALSRLPRLSPLLPPT